MYKVLNRLAWIVTLFIWSFIIYLDLDFTIFAIILASIIKFGFLSENFIKSNILEYNKKLEESILQKLYENKENHTQYEINPVIDNIQEAVNINENQRKVIEISEEKVDDISWNLEIIENSESQTSTSKLQIFLKDFFAENLIAKIGWILLALWVIFFMSLIYTLVWEIAKIIIGFAVWFWIYFIGIFLGKKWFKTESMILLWTWILINYIVILWGRFVIWDTNEWFLSSGITFLLLILNTIFSVITAFIYTSKNLLLFSLIFAFIIPFLIGERNTTPYLQIWYWLIIALWWLIISNYFTKNQSLGNAKQLFFISLIWWNILFLTAPFWENSSYFVIKMIGFNILNFVSLFLAYKNNFKKEILHTFIISFVFLWIILFSWSALNSIWILISFIIATLWFSLGISFFIISGVWIWLVYLLLLPLLFILGFSFMTGTESSIILFPLFIIAYLAIFGFWIWWMIHSKIKYLFFIILAVFLTIWNIHISFDGVMNLQNIVILNITAFWFIFFTYFLSRKTELSYLYTLWTLAGILILFPLIHTTGDFVFISVVSVILFWCVNYLLPFINSNLVKNGDFHLVLWSIFWVLFTGINIFNFWNEYFPGIHTGMAFLAVSLIYFLGWYILFNTNKKSQENTNQTYFIYTFLGIAISLFSIWIAFIFAKSPSIVAMIWLFQSTLLFAFAQKLEKKVVYYAWIILFAIWVIKFWEYFWYLSYDLYKQIQSINTEEINSTLQNWWFIKNYLFHFIGLIFIGISLFLNIFIFKKTKFPSLLAVNILHIIWVIILWWNILYLSSNYIIEYLLHWENFWIAYIIIWILIALFSIIYNSIWNKFTKYVLLIFTYLVLIFHIFQANIFTSYILNYVFTAIIWAIVCIDYLFIKSEKINHFKPLFYQFLSVFWVYIFIISSIYLYYHTNDAFSLTLYWWILSLAWVHLWISKENQIIRSIGLSLLIITLAKISFYDVWNTIDNPLIRVVALMFVWGIMLYISSLYSKHKLGFKNDFSFLWKMFQEKTTNIWNK